MEDTRTELLQDAKRYSLTGEYGGELQGVFQGELYFLSEGKIVGYMYDDGDMLSRKIILGKQNADRIQYWKMMPIQRMCYPIVCNFEEKNGAYEGKWIAFNNLEEYVEMLTVFPEISEAMFETDEKAIEILGGIANERLEEYFDPRLFKAIDIHGNPCSLDLQISK
jgi:hypothetical protein